jgi:cytochrome c-type biogenesis protein CcmH
VTVLVFVAALILLSVLWWLARPLTVQKAVTGDAERLQLEAVRDRLVMQLDELDVERAGQGMDVSMATDEQRRLEFELAQVLKQVEAMRTPVAGVASTVPRSRRWSIIALIALAVPFMAISLYVSQNRDTLTTLASVQAGGQANLPPMVMEMVGRLEKRLAAEPNDPKGWAQLGRSYEVLGRKADAVGAYAKAYQLAPNDVSIVAAYAWLLYQDDPSNTQGEVLTLYKALYRLDPSHQDAQWFLGLAAFQRGNYRDAIGFWEKLAAGLPAGSPAEQAISKALAEAKAKLKN